MTTSDASQYDDVWCLLCNSVGHYYLSCPLITAIEYYPNGKVKRIELTRAIVNQAADVTWSFTKEED